MPTIRDVARLAGVSHPAVSAVINKRNDQVSASTRERILKAMQELGYRPNRVARQLATGKFNTIMVCFAYGRSHSAVSGIFDAAEDADKYVLFAPSSEIKLVDVINDLDTHGVDGAIVMGPVAISNKTMDTIDKCPLPIVCIDSFPGFNAASTVDMDNSAGMRIGVEHLISQGHRRIAYIGELPVFQCFIDRMRAFCEVMQEHGISVDQNAIRNVSAKYAEGATRDILDSPERPTAIVCGSNHLLAKVWETLRNAGVSIPDDIALFTQDYPWDKQLPSPAIDANWDKCVSRVWDAPYKQGRAAVETLAKIISGEITPPVNVRVHPEFSLV